METTLYIIIGIIFIVGGIWIGIIHFKLKRLERDGRDWRRMYLKERKENEK